MICPDCLMREMERKVTTFRVWPAFVARTLWNCPCGAVHLLPATWGDVEAESLKRIAATRSAYERWSAGRFRDKMPRGKRAA
jgi:hypothetical protein